MIICSPPMRVFLNTLRYGNARRNVALLLLTALQWLFRYGVLWLALQDLGHHVPFGFVLVLQAVDLHLAQWTGIPAGGCSADLGLAAALGPQVTDPKMATALLLWRFSMHYIPLLVGSLSLVVLTCKWRTNATVTTETRN